MKRFFAAVLALLTLFSLFGCTTEVIPPSEPGTDVISFETADLDGAAVKSADIFGKNKITMINIWASWCGPCQSELPALERLSAELNDMGCGLIGILDDGDTDDGRASAASIMEALGITYPVLISNSSIREQLTFRYYPTTFFVDSEGRLVGEPIIGAQVDSYLPAVQALLASRD